MPDIPSQALSSEQKITAEQPVVTGQDSPVTGALILAAGRGTRMHSTTPKVLHTLLGEPMLWYIYQTLATLDIEHICTLTGYGAQRVQECFPRECMNSVLQKEQRGTGHALQTAWDNLRQAGLSHVLVINGDCPLAPAQRLQNLIDHSMATQADIAFLSLHLPDPDAYGRVVRDSAGRVRAVIEANDFNAAVHGTPSGEINAGIYLIRLDTMEALLPELGTDNASGECYITDLISLATERGLCVEAISGGEDPALLGINTVAELIRSEEILRRAIIGTWLEKGVCIRNPEQVFIGAQVRLSPGCQIMGPAELYGACRLEDDVCIASHTWIRDSTFEQGCVVHSFSHIEQAVLEKNCQAGPYARLRPGAHMEEAARVGNFVEIKKTRLGRGSKASHLSYLGDATLGEGINVGAGTITCNYDGNKKHQTILEDHVFIGSNTALVAPVTIGAGSLVGAGSVITQDVAPHTLALSRPPQQTLSRKK